MPISGDRYKLTPAALDRSPDEHGAYALYEGDRLLYVGSARGEGTIRSHLRRHKGGDFGQCTQRASHYRREVTEAGAERAAELLDEFKGVNGGRLPPCNGEAP
jgi:hypothetical protein